MFVEGGITGPHITAQLVTRLARHEVDHTAIGVAAIERALRAAQDFDLGNVDLSDVGHLRAGLVDAVDVNGHAGRAAEDGQADPADRQSRIATQRTAAQARDDPDEVRRIGEAAILKGFRRHGRDGRRHILNILRALVGGDDDDRIFGIFSRLAILSRSLRGHYGQGEGGSAAQQCGLHWHSPRCLAAARGLAESTSHCLSWQQLAGILALPCETGRVELTNVNRIINIFSKKERSATI